MGSFYAYYSVLSGDKWPSYKHFFRGGFIFSANFH